MKTVLFAIAFAFVLQASAVKITIDPEFQAKHPGTHLSIVTPPPKPASEMTGTSSHSQNGTTIVIVYKSGVWTATKNRKPFWTVKPFEICKRSPAVEYPNGIEGHDSVTTYKFKSGFAFSIDEDGTVICKNP